MIRKRGFFEHKRIIFILFIIFMAGQFVFFSSDYFSLRKAEIKGNRRMGKGEILAAANLDMGSNIFLFRPKDAAAKLEKLPGIKAAKVKVKLPSSVGFMVEERYPYLFAAKDFDSADWFGVDDEGIIIEKNPVEYMKQMPLLITGRDMKVGGSIPPEHIKIFSRVLSTMFPEEAEQVKWLRIDSGGGLSYNYSGKCGEMLIRFGEPSDLQKKFRILRKYLELEGKKDEKEREQIEMIDLASDPPVMRPKVKLPARGKKSGENK